jgi:hypothetical protein
LERHRLVGWIELEPFDGDGDLFRFETIAVADLATTFVKPSVLRAPSKTGPSIINAAIPSRRFHHIRRWRRICWGRSTIILPPTDRRGDR